MQGIKKIERLLLKRLNFFQELLVVISSQKSIKLQTQKYVQTHLDLSKMEKDLIICYSSTIRVDQKFRKQFHILSCAFFKKFNLNSKNSKQKNGLIKHIVSDYVQFFLNIKQKFIAKFIHETFQAIVQCNEKTIFLLLETLLKYLRIKVEHLLKKIMDKATYKEIQFPVFMKKPSIQNKPSKSIVRLNKSSSKIKQRDEYVQSNIKTQLQQQRRYLSPKSRLRKRSISRQKNNILSSLKVSTQSTTVCINKNNSTLKSFYMVFGQEWSNYLKFINIPDLDITYYQSSSNSRKDKWMKQNCQKLINETLFRNTQGKLKNYST